MRHCAPPRDLSSRTRRAHRLRGARSGPHLCARCRAGAGSPGRSRVPLARTHSRSDGQGGAARRVGQGGQLPVSRTSRWSVPLTGVSLPLLTEAGARRTSFMPSATPTSIRTATRRCSCTRHNERRRPSVQAECAGAPWAERRALFDKSRGGIVALVKRSRDKETDLGGRAVPISVVVVHLPGLLPASRLHRSPAHAGRSFRAGGGRPRARRAGPPTG